MARQKPQPGVIQSKSSRTACASSYVPLAETQLQRSHQLVHRDAVIVATENMAQDAHSKKVRKTGRSNNRQQHAIRCEYLYIDIEGSQLTIYYTARVCRELHVQYIAAWNVTPPWSTKALIRTVREIEHHNVVSSGIYVGEFRDKGPRE
jgi:hypothetical protein